MEKNTNTYYACMENIATATKAVYDNVLEKAVEEEKKANVANWQEDTFIVSGDGPGRKEDLRLFTAWHKEYDRHSGKIKILSSSTWETKKTQRRLSMEHKETLALDGITEMFARSEELVK